MNLVPLLLADPSPCLRYLVLYELMKRPKSDPEVEELSSLREEDPLITDLVKLQAEDGSWRGDTFTGSSYQSRIVTTSFILHRFGYLGFTTKHPSVRKGADFLLESQQDDGSWPIPSDRSNWVDGVEQVDPYTMIPLQTAFPSRALASCGLAEDNRVEKAYEWLIEQRLDDGSWPVGVKSGRPGYIAGYRKLAHSRWGCRSNTTAVLSSLSYHPKRCKGKEARRAIDLLLGRETKEKTALGFEVARRIGVEPTRGYISHYAKFDVAFLLDLCWRSGANRGDERVADIVEFILLEQGRYGLWEYNPRPEASRWITFDILRSLSRIDESTDWLSHEPRTPFQAYPKRERRY